MCLESFTGDANAYPGVTHIQSITLTFKKLESVPFNPLLTLLVFSEHSLHLSLLGNMPTPTCFKRLFGSRTQADVYLSKDQASN